MRVCLIKNTATDKYYLMKGRWSEEIFKESYLTERGAKWNKTYLEKQIRYKWVDGGKVPSLVYEPNTIVIETYEMVLI